MRISEAARKMRVSVSTVRSWIYAGKIKPKRTPAGQYWFEQSDIDEILGERREGVAFYVRSSKGDEKALENQVKLLRQSYGEPTVIYRDKGSGLSDSRPGLTRALRASEKGDFGTIAATHPDRFARWGRGFLYQLFQNSGVTVETLQEKSDDIHEEMMTDFLSIIAHFSGRFYRLRGIEQKKKLLDDASKRIDNG